MQLDLSMMHGTNTIKRKNGITRYRPKESQLCPKISSFPCWRYYYQ